VFGIFNKQPKQQAIDEDTLLLAGVTAGVAFKLMEKKFGITPANEVPKILDGCKKTACEMLSINPDQQSRSVMHMVALTFAMDETGVAQGIANRYERGDKGISREEGQKIWDLTLKQTQAAVENTSKNGKR